MHCAGPGSKGRKGFPRFPMKSQLSYSYASSVRINYWLESTMAVLNASRGERQALFKCAVCALYLDYISMIAESGTAQHILTSDLHRMAFLFAGSSDCKSGLLSYVSY